MQLLQGKGRRMTKRFCSEDGSFTVEAAFVFSLILMILGGIMLFSFVQHDRVLQLSSAMIAGGAARRSTEASAAVFGPSGTDPDAGVSGTQEGFLISVLTGLRTEDAGDRIRVSVSMNSRISASGSFAWLRKKAVSHCGIRMRRFSDPAARILSERAEREENGF